MKQIGNVFILEEEEWAGSCEYFEDKIIIYKTIIPNPRKVWPDDPRMFVYINDQNRKLIELGIFNEEILGQFKNREKPITIVAQFKTLEAAEYKFEELLNAGIVDIYLYRNGELFRKYD